MSNIKFLSKPESLRLIRSTSNDKHRLMILLMLDAGLRVSEMCSLRLSDFDFKEKVINVRSLKKRGREVVRVIPISDRLYKELAQHLKGIDTSEPSLFLFPSSSASGHISRQSVWRVIKRKQHKEGFSDMSPHSLRHSFATHMYSDGTELEKIKVMLGHNSYNTTLIYAHIPVDQLKAAVNGRPRPRFFDFITRGFKLKSDPVINLSFKKDKYTIGRNTEIQQLENNARRGINTLVKGEIGYGKTHLINLIEHNSKTLRLEDSESIKKALINILLHLYSGDKSAVLSLIYTDESKVGVEMNRETSLALCQRLIDTTDKNEYIILIDDITRITPAAKKIIERLKDHFTFIVGARRVSAKDASFLWNFEHLELKPLSRHYALLLINHLSSGLEIENWEAYRNHIWNQTNGNPRAISELVDRYSKEPFLSREVVTSIKHTGALSEIDMSWLLIVSLGSVMALRYMSAELGVDGFKFIGGLAMIILIMLRPLQRSLKRHFL